MRWWRLGCGSLSPAALNGSTSSSRRTTRPRHTPTCFSLRVNVTRALPRALPPYASRQHPHHFSASYGCLRRMFSSCATCGRRRRPRPAKCLHPMHLTVLCSFPRSQCCTSVRFEPAFITTEGTWPPRRPWVDVPSRRSRTSAASPRAAVALRTGAGKRASGVAHVREFSRQSRSRERPYTVQSYKPPSISAFAPGGAKLADFGLEIDALL